MNFLIWLKENGSINQSMPELDFEDVPKGSMITSNPYSFINNSSLIGKRFDIKAKEDSCLETKEKISQHPGSWVIKQISNNFLKVKNFNDGFITILPIKNIEIV
jgi:hypothetical protein